METTGQLLFFSKTYQCMRAMASLLSEANGGKKYLLMRNKKSRIKITNCFFLVD